MECRAFSNRSIRTEKPYVAFYGTQGILFFEDPNCFGGDVKVLMKGQMELMVFSAARKTKDFSGREPDMGVIGKTVNKK